VLGSVKIPENRASELRTDILERLTKKGLVSREGRHGLVAAHQSEVIDLASQARELQRALESLEKRLRAAQAAGRPRREVQELTDRLGTQRRLFPGRVHALRLLADQAQRTREVIEHDEEVRIALAELNRLRTRPGQPEVRIAPLPDYLWICRAYHSIWLVLSASLGGLLLSVLLKGVFQRPRPSLTPYRTHVSLSIEPRVWQVLQPGQAGPGLGRVPRPLPGGDRRPVLPDRRR
jgi:hypothetical protein